MLQADDEFFEDETEQFVPVVAGHARVFHENYTLGDVLGAGVYAQVRLCSRCRTPSAEEDGDEEEISAAKIVDLREVSSSHRAVRKAGALSRAKYFQALQESTIWRRATAAQSKYIVRLHDFFLDLPGCNVYFVMERCDGALLTILRDAADLVTECLLSKLFFQMASALADLHRMQIVHCDVKLDNFFVHGSCHMADECCGVKLGDFGLSSISQRGCPTKGTHGTPIYMSPEMLREGQYTEKTDVWSLGVAIYLLMYGRFPYWARDRTAIGIKMAIRSGMQLPSFRLSKNVVGGVTPSSNMEALIRKLLDRSPNSRLFARDIVHDPWLLKCVDVPQREAVAAPSMKANILSAASSMQQPSHPPHKLDRRNEEWASELQAETRLAPVPLKQDGPASSSTPEGSGTTTADTDILLHNPSTASSLAMKEIAITSSQKSCQSVSTGSSHGEAW
mmetsp:Transcript_11304/g.25991  ORF Transcript_11304/g.25991 Transcript_11304/m.25991 type:complete len:449 (+) Transcript_11304:44-1390(+)